MAALALLSVCLFVTAPSSPASAETRAGTPITNIAALSYDASGQTQSTPSNPTTLIVAERLDVLLARDGQGPVAVRSDPTPVPFTLTNAGNGDERFAVAASIASDAVAVQAIVVDTDGDGLYDPARDTVLDDGVTPVLAPGQVLKLLAILTARTDTPVADGSLTVTARATTGSGQPGTSYAGQGDGGGDAVVGPTGAAASLAVPFGAQTTAPTLIKSQSVRANDGSATPYRDAIITYSLEARFVSALADARIDDAIPTGTTYVPGSLTLDGAALTDGVDGDAGAFDGSTGGGAITVALPRVAAGSTHIVQFKTKIQ